MDNNGRYTLTKTGTMIPDAEGYWVRRDEVEANRAPHSMQHVTELQAMNNRLGAQIEALQRAAASEGTSLSVLHALQERLPQCQDLQLAAGSTQGVKAICHYISSLQTALDALKDAYDELESQHADLRSAFDTERENLQHQIAVRGGLVREFVEHFDGDFVNPGLELYGLVNGQELRNSGKLLNELLDKARATLTPAGGKTDAK